MKKKNCIFLFIFIRIIFLYLTSIQMRKKPTGLQRIEQYFKKHNKAIMKNNNSTPMKVNTLNTTDNKVDNPNVLKVINPNTNKVNNPKPCSFTQEEIRITESGMRFRNEMRNYEQSLLSTCLTVKPFNY